MCETNSHSDSNGTLSEMDLWRLSDALPIVAAAMLVAGLSPADRFLSGDGDYRIGFDRNGEKQKKYDAAFSSLRGAILANRLRANVKFSMRGSRSGQSVWLDRDGNERFESYEVVEMPHEEQVSYDMLIANAAHSEVPVRRLDAETKLNFDLDTLRSEPLLYICKEPNWMETTVDVQDLKLWLSERGVFPVFFFPKGKAEGFRDPQNERYSAKLACAVAAWEAVKEPGPNESPKQTLAAWVQSNEGRLMGWAASK
ncbi:MAG: hypothetical protein N4A53_11750 [Pelagimonas sp.]|nr:hypothetical protein [Pelagimonas sp.]